MEGERKKRKLENEEKEEDDEEKKMEMFFALIRSTRVLRDRLRGGLSKTKETDEEKREKAIWSPTFQPEDFMEVGKSNSPGDSQAGPSKTDKEEEEKEKTKEDNEEGEDKGLDLNLSL